jgi:hypothetical protein
MSLHQSSSQQMQAVGLTPPEMLAAFMGNTSTMQSQAATCSSAATGGGTSAGWAGQCS